MMQVTLPEFKGIKDFKGQIVHPQKWTEDIDYKNKNVVIIGSGATAVTLSAIDGRNSSTRDHVTAFANLCDFCA
jgi:cation diffusion facilitator CzcD-associated flavoprotein CzcO